MYSQVHYLGSFAFPAVADVGLRVKSLGQSSVIYELALFEQGIDQVKSVGEYVHVFVDRATGRPAARGMNATVRGGLQRIAVGPQAKL